MEKLHILGVGAGPAALNDVKCRAMLQIAAPAEFLATEILQWDLKVTEQFRSILNGAE